MVFRIVIDRFERVVNLFLCNTALAKFGGNDALGDLLMLMARFCPGESKFLIVNESSLSQAEDSCLRYLIFNSAGFEVSEQLPLTLCTCYERIERDCICSFVRVGAALYLLIEK